MFYLLYFLTSYKGLNCTVYTNRRVWRRLLRRRSRTARTRHRTVWCTSVCWMVWLLLSGILSERRWPRSQAACESARRRGLHVPESSQQRTAADVRTLAAEWTSSSSAEEKRATSAEANTTNHHFVMIITKEHCIQRITFAAETNAACSHGHIHTDAERHNIFSAR